MPSINGIHLILSNGENCKLAMMNGIIDKGTVQDDMCFDLSKDIQHMNIVRYIDSFTFVPIYYLRYNYPPIQKYHHLRYVEFKLEGELLYELYNILKVRTQWP